MRAMILAAGLGTRLRPLTDDRPKALVEIGGKSLLQLTIERLRAFGVREVIVNVHHFADRVVEHIEAHDGFGIRVEVSREAVLLDTGGGLRNAAWFFLEDPDRLDEPFVLHNVDVITTIDLGKLRRFLVQNGALATLAVQDRPTRRPLLFDAEGRLSGHRTADGQETIVREQTGLREREFTGVHVISPRLLGLIGKAMGPDLPKVFSIIPVYLRLAAMGYPIVGFDADAFEWRDVGSPESLEQARSLSQ